MATCPQCRFENPDGAVACAWCGEVFVSSAFTLRTPLPAPMVEPIHTPTKSQDSQPLPAKPALTVAFGGAPSAATVPDTPRVGDPTPAPGTLLNVPEGDSPSRDRNA